jgi:hypothetical protein
MFRLLVTTEGDPCASDETNASVLHDRVDGDDREATVMHMMRNLRPAVLAVNLDLNNGSRDGGIEFLQSPNPEQTRHASNPVLLLSTSRKRRRTQALSPKCPECMSDEDFTDEDNSDDEEPNKRNKRVPLRLLGPCLPPHWPIFPAIGPLPPASCAAEFH